MAIDVLIVGCGHMGTSHALAYRQIGDFRIVGVVSRGAASRSALSLRLGGVSEYADFYRALEETRPGAVSINTYPDTHAEFTLAALRAGAHVFVEKPIAQTVADARTVTAEAERRGKKVVVGYILRHHPSWRKFIEIARTLGKPLVMRMNLNQQSSGEEWRIHKNLMTSLPPIVDCGVHYVDVMCQMTRARPVRVHAIGARLSSEVDTYNYGQLQVVFDDGSVGWYEAGWGPMMSETAHFVKDVVGPDGSVSIVTEEGDSADIDSHTKTDRLRVHDSALDGSGDFTADDRMIDMSTEPDHLALCLSEQEYFLEAISKDLDMADHLSDAVSSLEIVLAADRSFREGRSVDL